MLVLQAHENIVFSARKCRREIYLEINAYIFPREITLRVTTLGEPSRSPSARARSAVRTRIPGDRGSTCAAAKKMRPPGRLARRWRDGARREAGSCERTDSTATATTTNARDPCARIRDAALHGRPRGSSRIYLYVFARARARVTAHARRHPAISAQGAAGSRRRCLFARDVFIDSTWLALK